MPSEAPAEQEKGPQAGHLLLYNPGFSIHSAIARTAEITVHTKAATSGTLICLSMSLALSVSVAPSAGIARSAVGTSRLPVC
jgi:hypothetical protein